MEEVFQDSSVNGNKSSIANDFRSVNKRTITYILTKKASAEDVIQGRVDHVKTTMIEKWKSYQDETSKRISLVDDFEKEIKMLRSELERSDLILKNKERELSSCSEKLAAKQKENAAVTSEFQILKEEYDETSQELQQIKSEYEKLETLYREKNKSFQGIEIDFKRCKHDLEHLVIITQAISREQFIEVSVEEICRTVNKVQESFYANVQKIANSLKEQFEKKAAEFKQKKSDEFDERINISNETWRDEFTKMHEKATEDVWAQNELYEKRIKDLQTQHDEEVEKYEEKIKNLREEYKKKIQLKCGEEIRFRRDQEKNHLTTQSNLRKQISELTIQKESLESRSRNPFGSTGTMNTTIEIIVQFKDFEDMDAVQIQLDLYRQCISILERMDGTSSLPVYQTEIKNICKKIFQWKEVPLTVKSSLEKMEGILLSTASKPHTVTSEDYDGDNHDDDDDDDKMDSLHTKPQCEL